jgi:hypothetical protein
MICRHNGLGNLVGLRPIDSTTNTTNTLINEITNTSIINQSDNKNNEAENNTTTDTNNSYSK